MVCDIQIETWSLVFACLSVSITSLGSLMCISVMVYVNVLAANLNSGGEKKTAFQEEITHSSLYINIGLASLLAVMVVALGFSIILIKGLLSKKASLVKAYFIYGVTTNTFVILKVLSAFIILGTLNQIGLVILFSCFLHCLILMMIKKTYLKFQTTDCDQFSHKKLEEEKSVA